MDEKKLKCKLKYNMKKHFRFFAQFSFVALCVGFASVAYAAQDTDTVNLEVDVQSNLSLDCGGSGIDPDVDFGVVTAGTPVVGTSTCSVTTNHEEGYDLFVDRTTNGNTHVLQHTDTTTYIADLTAWNGSNAAAWTNGTTTGLGFRVQSVSGATKNDTWWGASTSCTSAEDATALFAGVPEDPDTATPIPVMDHDTYSSAATTATICYKLDVASTQKSGTYSGDITYTAIGKP
jgi:hypothetical protein